MNSIVIGLLCHFYMTSSTHKIMQLMQRGENNQRIGETNMNERSSQSHTIFRIVS